MLKKTITNRIIRTAKFLKESNAIEGVYNKASFKNSWKAWAYIVKQPHLTKKNILQTHKILMKNHLSRKVLGFYRKCNVRIGTSYGSPWPEVPKEVEIWTNKINQAKTIKKIKDLHVKFEKIHPFIDGNGRTGRILMNYARQKNKIPILIIKEAEKQKYYKWFS